MQFFNYFYNMRMSVQLVTLIHFINWCESNPVGTIVSNLFEFYKMLTNLRFHW
jgi:hypothetical protein